MNERICSIESICTDDVDNLWINCGQNEGFEMCFIEGILTYDLWGILRVMRYFWG